MRKLSENEIATFKSITIDQLDALTDADPESAHSIADVQLLTLLSLLGCDDVVAAYKNAVERVGFWYA
jgi:hypothetical protein